MIAALINVFVPGLGQLLQGRVITAVVLFVLVIVGYICFVVPGLVLHLLAIVDAAQHESRQQKRAHHELIHALKHKS